MPSAGEIIKRVAFPSLFVPLWITGRLRRRRLVVYCESLIYLRKSQALADLLTRRGFRAQVRSGISFAKRVSLKASPDVWIGFFGNPSWSLPRNYVMWNADALDRHRDHTGIDADWFVKLGNARCVWGYTHANAEQVARLGVPFRYVPFGYAPYYESSFRKHVAGKQLTQDIDVLFFGALTERRLRVLDELEQRDMRVHIVSKRKVYGEALDELLARSRIVLGIHSSEEPELQIVDLARLDHLLSNRLFVVHERPSALASDPAFERNVTTCEYRQIADTCAHFLARPEERAKRSASAYEWFKSEYRLDDFIPYDEVRQLLARRALSRHGAETVPP